MDLGDWLEDIYSDLRNDHAARKLAGDMLEQLRRGVIPSPKKVRELRKIQHKVAPCARLQRDGSCAWLRKNAKLEGLRMPRANERAYCKRTSSGPYNSSFEGCAGYRKEKPE